MGRRLGLGALGIALAAACGVAVAGVAVAAADYFGVGPGLLPLGPQDPDDAAPLAGVCVPVIDRRVAA